MTCALFRGGTTANPGTPYLFWTDAFFELAELVERRLDKAGFRSRFAVSIPVITATCQPWSYTREQQEG